jgi:cyclase
VKRTADSSRYRSGVHPADSNFNSGNIPPINRWAIFHSVAFADFAFNHNYAAIELSLDIPGQGKDKMNRALALLTLSIFVLTPTGLRPAVPPLKPEDDFKLVKVADGNAGFIIGDNGVLVVDTFLTPAAIDELLAEIQNQTTQPVRYAVNTHYHLDHTGGNQVLAARGVPIFAHDNVVQWELTKNRRFLPLPEELTKRRDDLAKQLNEVPAEQAEKRSQIERQIRRVDAMSAIKLTSPSVTFSTGIVRLHLGQREVLLFTLPGHTGGDVLVYVPDANVLFTGDMGWSRTLPNLVDASVNDWINSVQTILDRYPAAKFVPGHGETATAVEMREFKDYLDDLRVRVKQAINDGLTLDQAKQQLKLPEKYKNFAFQTFVQPNVEDMYKELKGTKQSQ